MQEEIELLVITDDENKIPSYASEEAAGADVKADIAAPVALSPGSAMMIPTGIKIEIPYGFEVQVRPRSGLALKHGITVLNSPGTIDSDYRGPINVILINHGKTTFIIEPGMRIAQLVVAPVVQARFIKVDDLTSTARGEGGFGHSGLM